MKIKIARPDGTVIEAEGTAEECAVLIGAPAPYVPFMVPTPFVPDVPPPYGPQPWDVTSVPTWTTDRITVSTDEIANGVAAGTITYTSPSPS